MQRNLALICFLTFLLCLPKGLRGSPVDSLLLRIEELQATDQTSELLAAMQALAQQYKKERSFDNLESLLSKGLRLAELQQDELRRFYFLLSLGEYYYFPEDDYPQSIAYLLKARSLGEKVATPERLAHTLSMIAEVYLSLGDFQQALDYQLSALDLAQKSGDTTSLALSYRNMGAIYWNQQAYESALDYFKRALRLYEGSGDPHRLFTYLASVGAALVELDDPEQALFYAERARTLSDSVKDEYGVAYSQGLIGGIFLKQNQYEEALKHFKESVRRFSEQGIKREAASFGLQIANVYVLMDQPRQALEALETAGELIFDLKTLTLLRDFYDTRAEAYRKLGRIDDSYEDYRTYIQYKDSLLNEEKATQIANLRHRYEVEKKEQEISELKQDKQDSQRELLIYAFVAGIGFLLLLLWMVYYRNKSLQEINQLLAKKNEEIRLQNERLANSNLELRQFAHITSHDLREPLRSIGSFATLLKRRYQQQLDQEADEFISFITTGVDRMDHLLGDLLTYSAIGIFEQDYLEVNLQKVISSIIQQLQRDEQTQGARITLHEIPTLVANPKQMGLLFQHLIENAIKFRGKAKPLVRIAATPVGEGYQFVVEDNGIGMEAEHQAKIFQLFNRLHKKGSKYEGTGLGLSICKKIVEQHKGTIWIESTPGEGTRVFFTLPQSPIEPDEA